MLNRKLTNEMNFLDKMRVFVPRRKVSCYKA